MRRIVLAIFMAVGLSACGSYVQYVTRDGVECIVKRAEINNHVQSVQCPKPYVVNGR